MSLLALIPARGGSKGIPRKNIRSFCGKPLMQWTIDVALSSPSVDRVWSVLTIPRLQRSCVLAELRFLSLDLNCKRYPSVLILFCML